MLTIAELPEKLKNRVHHELERGERVQWLETAVPHFLDGSSTLKFLVSLPCTGFSIYWMVEAAKTAQQDGFRFFYLFGLPFLLIGLGLMSSPILVYFQSSWTVYLLTSHRAIVIQYRWWKTVTWSFFPEEINTVFRKDLWSGTGDVILGRREWLDSEGSVRGEDLGFLGVREAKEVERQVRRWREDHRRKKNGEPPQ